MTIIAVGDGRWVEADDAQEASTAAFSGRKSRGLLEASYPSGAYNALARQKEALQVTLFRHPAGLGAVTRVRGRRDVRRNE